MNPSTGLQLRQVSISVAGAKLIDDLNLSIGPGEAVTIMGPSGSGKSTLLSFIAGFASQPAIKATGSAELDGTELTSLPPERRRVGLLFQDDLLFPHLNVAGNLMFAMPASIAPHSARLKAAEAALESAGLGGLGRRDPTTLSGGQKARVALLRVLLSQPKALLLDEPFSKLDSELRASFRELVFAEARARHLPVLLVTHDPDDAAAAGGPVIRLS